MTMQINKRRHGLPFGVGCDGCRRTACALATAPARITSIDRESNLQNSNDLDRTSRGVGCMGVFGGSSGIYVLVRIENALYQPLK